jgi:Lysozyme like domain
MAVISDAQIAGAARAVGLSGHAVAVAVAVAIAESGGDTHAHNTRAPDNSYGLWQINMWGTLGPTRRLMLGIPNNEALFDPLQNARAMARISLQGKNWLPWSTYTRGTYKQYLARGEAVQGSGSDSGGILPDLPSVPGSGTLDSLNAFLDRLISPATWWRIGLGVAGGILVLIALIKMSGATGRVTNIAIGAAKTYATKGAK